MKKRTITDYHRVLEKLKLRSEKHFKITREIFNEIKEYEPSKLGDKYIAYYYKGKKLNKLEFSFDKVFKCWGIRIIEPQSKSKEEERDRKLEELLLDKKLLELGTKYHLERSKNFSKYKYLLSEKLNELISNHIFKKIEGNYRSLSPGVDKKFYRIKIEDKVYLVGLKDKGYSILSEETEIIELV